jgi:hypothetical protein
MTRIKLLRDNVELFRKKIDNKETEYDELMEKVKQCNSERKTTSFTT